jgi:hypothetical protein
MEKMKREKKTTKEQKEPREHKKRSAACPSNTDTDVTDVF